MGRVNSLCTCTQKTALEEKAGGRDKVMRYKVQRKTKSTLKGWEWSGGQAQLTMFIP